MNESLVTVILAFTGYSLLNVGQAGQKIGLEICARRTVAGWSVWSVSTLATAASFLFVFAAIAAGSVAIAGAMAGTGLASMALFSRFVLKEKLTPRTIVSIGVIIASAALLAAFDRPGGGTSHTGRLFILLAIGIIGYGVAILAAPTPALKAVITGGLSGFLGAASQLFQRLSTETISAPLTSFEFVLQVIADPVTLAWVGLSAASMLVIQFAYRHAEALRIVPVFTANFIVLPAIGGAIVFGETLHPLQWAAIAMMLAGSFLLAGRSAAASA